MWKKKLHLEEWYSDPDWSGPNLVYGQNLIRQATATDERYAVLTMEIPWNLVKNEVDRQPEKVLFVPDMHLATLERLEREIPAGIEMVIGVGGGSAHDAAKYVALKRQIRLLQFPTIFGGDSVVCAAVGIREDRRVKYIGHTRAEKVYVDFDIIRQAPPRLVRYGASDILSSYTALMDWELAAKRGKAELLPDSVNTARNVLLKRLMDNADDIRELTDQGIKTMVDLFVEYAKLANRSKTDRAQEGSEHFFAYNAEYITGRTYVHGALLSMGIYVIGGYYYDKRVEIGRYLDALGQDHTLDTMGVSPDEFRETLRTLQAFSQNGYYYSIAHEKPLDDKTIEAVLKDISR